jgi:abhydrolase domain-containing protein 12
MLPSGEAAILASSYTLDKEDAVGRESLFDSLLPGAERVFVYFHGTSNTRAFNHRIPIMRKLASHFNAHVVTIDYRGFGDSEGYPSETGTALDSRATIDWLRSRLDAHSGSDGKGGQVPVYIYGQSLGTAVATELVARGTGKGGSGPSFGSGFAGLILDAGFSELPTAALTHPVGAPFRLIPAVREYIWAHFQIQYSNLALMPAVAEGGTHVLMLHGKADWKVSPDNSRRLFQVFACVCFMLLGNVSTCHSRF